MALQKADARTGTPVDLTVQDIQDIKSKLNLDNIDNQSFSQIENTVNSISAGEGGKVYDTLAAAQALNPKPSDGTIFQVSKQTDALNAGYYSFQTKSNDINLLDESLIVDGGVKTNGDVIQSPFLGVDYKRVRVNNLLPETTYTFSANDKFNPSASKNINFYDINGTFLENVKAEIVPKTFTTPVNTSYLLMNVSVSGDDDNISEVYNLDLMINEGATALPYENGSNIKFERDYDNVKSNWNGLKWTSFGDSITFRESWQPFVYNELGLIHTNEGINSTFLAGETVDAFWQDVRLNAVKSSNPDIISILGGANDLSNILIGTDAEFEKTLANKDKTTFKGAYSYIIENLLTWKPSLRIFILTTTWANDNGKNFPPPSGLIYTDFSNACKDVALYYGVPYVDLHGEAGFNNMTNDIYLPDNLHPNEAGGKRIAELVIGKLRSINPL